MLVVSKKNIVSRNFVGYLVGMIVIFLFLLIGEFGVLRDVNEYFENIKVIGSIGKINL